MEEFRYRKHAGSDEIVSSLNNFGLAIIDDFYSTSEVNCLNKEFEKAFSLAEDAGTKRSVLNGQYGLCPREMVDFHKQDLPQFFKLLHDRKLSEVGGMYFQIREDQFHRINNHVEVEINESTGISNASLPHFDRMPALKMFVYLVDVDADNGPTFVYPKTYISVRDKIFAQLNQIGDVHELKNFIREESINSLRNTICGKKGTLIIADSSSLHGGGNIRKEGLVRKTIRATTWYLPVSHQKLSKQALPIKDSLFILKRHSKEYTGGIDFNAFQSWSELSKGL